MGTKFDEVVDKLKERLLLIKKNDTCHVNNQIYDVTIDQVFTNILEWKNRKEKQGLNMVIVHESGEIVGHVANKRIETYNVDIEIEYNKPQTASDNEYELYYNNLVKWIYVILTDETTTINDFWRQIYKKTGFCGFKWKIGDKFPPKGFRMLLKLENLSIMTDINEMFV